jgi:predicted DNA-binding transcriptional regulator AlpA
MSRNTTDAGAAFGRPEATSELNAKLTDATGKRLLSRSEFCSILNLSCSTAERWGRLNVGPLPVKVGPRRVGYRLADVLAFIERRQNEAA